jgi:hypothetical protein
VISFGLQRIESVSTCPEDVAHKTYIDFAWLTGDVHHSSSLASRTDKAEVMLEGNENLGGRKKIGQVEVK